MTGSTLTTGELAQAAELALANHILAKKEIVDGFGHVSVRSVERHDRFLLCRAMAPSLVQIEDIFCFDLDGECVSATGVRSYVERFIHSEIYRARPDVMSVVHSHSCDLISFGIVPTHPLRPVYHMSAFIGGGVPVFDIRDTVEHSDMLIRDPRLGKALAATLGTASATLMRGHGAAIVGKSIRHAVFRSVYLALNADIQMKAVQLGPPIFLSDEEAAAATTENENHIDRPWALWVREVQAETPNPSGCDR